jgi:hypothetical protein
VHQVALEVELEVLEPMLLYGIQEAPVVQLMELLAAEEAERQDQMAQVLTEEAQALGSAGMVVQVTLV